MAELDRCFKLHLDLSSINNLEIFIKNIAKISDMTFDNKNNFFIWLKDDKYKKDLIKCLNKSGIKEYFCEPVMYESVGKDREFNFISAWFMDKYKAFLYRKAEKENQQQLKQMYENIQKAQAELDNINRDGDSLDDKQSILKEAQDV